MTSHSHACTLTPAGARDRLPQARALTARLRDRDRTGNRLVLRFADDGRTAGLVDQFVEDESQCCSFFDFATRREEGQVVLELAAPADAQPLLDAAMATFDPALGDDDRLALHAEVTDRGDPPPGGHGEAR